MRQLWTLYKKELAGTKLNFFLVVGIILFWETFLATRHGKWPGDLIFGLSFLPFALLPFWAVIGAVQSLRREWNENSIYVLLSLPTRGASVIGAKTLALVTELTAYVLLVPFFSWLLANGTRAPALLPSNAGAVLLDVTLKGFWLYWFVLVMLTVVGQFSYLVGALLDRFQWLVAGWVFLVSAYLLTRGAQVISPVFAWVPDLPLRSYSEVNGIPMIRTVYVDAAPLAGTVVIAAAMFVAASLLMEKGVEV